MKQIILLLLFFSVLFAHACMAQKESDSSPISKEHIKSAEVLFGLEFTDQERELMLPDVQAELNNYEATRSYKIPNGVPMALDFNPVPPGMIFKKEQDKINWMLPKKVELPENREELAFYSIGELAYLIKNKKITSTELTQIYLERLKKYGDTLECVITITEKLALEQANRADAEIATGKYRGILHGIPYGVKDLLATEGYKTTWGAMPYKDQTINETATVVKKLEEAGAVLVAKLTLGALAWGDVWYDGTTRNPWNLEQGSSGSSAGSASATVAGLVAFSIGTETLGSIVSPSTRCGATGLRPTYGRVSRHGAMALSWSMDKIGPICRSAEDCAIVFSVIHGTDGLDHALVDLPFNYNAKVDLSTLKVGYIPAYFNRDYNNKERDLAVLKTLEGLGATLLPMTMPDDIPLAGLRSILTVEAAAAFDELTRSNRDSLMVRQIRNAWPNVFRQSRLISAVEYVQANRLRYLLVQQMNEEMKKFDVVVTPSFVGSQLLVTNLTGHPCVVVPNGFNESGSPTSISFIGNLYDEATILAVARAYQRATTFDEQHPPRFK